MNNALLSAHREPTFAALATDPTSAGTRSGRSFGEIAAELLAPHSYGERHYFSPLTGVECAACAPHRISFLASRPGETGPETKVVEPTAIIRPDPAGKRRRRETAKQFGPAPKRGH